MLNNEEDDIEVLTLTSKGFLQRETKDVKKETFACPLTKYKTQKNSIKKEVRPPLANRGPGVRYDVTRKSFVATAEHKYKRRSKSFPVRQFVTEEIALQKATEWQKATVVTMKEINVYAKRTFLLSPEMEQKAKKRGIRIDRHNGVFLAFAQRDNLKVCKTFSYREDQEKALDLALAFRKEMMQITKDQFQQLTKKRKREATTHAIPHKLKGLQEIP